jgi:hypothetical protein
MVEATEHGIREVDTNVYMYAQSVSESLHTLSRPATLFSLFPHR